jgi:hypothetical protein
VELVADYVHPYRAPGGARGKRRVRVYLPEDERDLPLVLVSELPDDPAGALRRSMPLIAVAVCRSLRLERVLCVEHLRPDTREEAFALVRLDELDQDAFGAYRVGLPSREPLDRRTVELLVSGAV